MTTYTIYEGPSALDGQPIVVLAQVGTKNSKTGDMMQTFILRSDIDPITANRTGADESICGTCPLKGKAHNEPQGLAKERTCYVNLGHGPLAKFKKLHRTGYPKCDDLVALGRGRRIRIGTYGDGMAVPHKIWAQLLKEAEGWTAYTHQYNFFPEVYMTSVENVEQAKAAWTRGERTFRVVNSVNDITKDEVLCPASEEAGKRTTCARCGLCQGATSRGKSVAIPAHGVGRKYHEKVETESLCSQR